MTANSQIPSIKAHQKPAAKIGSLGLGASLGLRRSTAFTLVEMMIVVAIIGLVLAIGIPSMFRMAEKDSLRQAVKGIVEACTDTRAAAILSGETKVLTVRPGDRTLDVPGKGSFKLPERFSIESVDVNLVDVREYASAPVRFFANGTSDEFIIVISDHGMDKKFIELESVTALPQVDTEETTQYGKLKY